MEQVLENFGSYEFQLTIFSSKLLQLTEDDVYLSYLPLAHIFDRVIEESFISHGASIGFWRGVSYLNVGCHVIKQ